LFSSAATAGSAPHLLSAVCPENAFRGGRLSNTDTAIKQAELILKLYELRREPVMRSARSYVGGEFLPRSFEDFLAITSARDQHTAYVLQVYGYWDMIAAMVFHGALDESLV
jgi:hypothetical protein